MFGANSSMSKIIVYSVEDREIWDHIVRSFKPYDTYWLNGYVKGFRLHGDGEPLLIYFENKNCRGINVVMKRDVSNDPHFKNRIPLGKYFDLSCPYGYGGWLIEGDNTEELFTSYKDWCSRNDIISEFIRFHPIVKNHEECRKFYEVTKLGEVVHMDLATPALIWENITSKNRNVIRKAIKNDIKIYNGRFPEIYETFRNIYNETMDKDNAEEYYYFEPEFYKSILDDLAWNAQVFYAVKGEKVIAASIILAANGMMDYHLSGSLREYSSLAPTNLLLYGAALWGCANGYRSLYLGGGVGSGQDNLFKFKRAFNKGNLNHFYIGKRIYNQQKYNELLDMIKPIDSNYFPEYRG